MLQNGYRTGSCGRHHLSPDSLIHVWWRHSGCTGTSQTCHISIFQPYSPHCTVDASKSLPAVIYRMDQPTHLNPISMLLLNFSISWNCLHNCWPVNLRYTSVLWDRNKISAMISLADVTERTLPGLPVPALMSASTCARRATQWISLA